MGDIQDKIIHALEQIDSEKKLAELQRQIDELQKNKKEADQTKKEEISLAQQLLLLYYLGWLNKVDMTITAKSFLLSKILNRSKDNIKKNLTYINSPKISHSKIKNTENLKTVMSFFEESKMPEVAERVKVDINKVNKE